MIIIYIVIAFLLGIVFVQWIIPLFDGIINIFLTQLEVWKGKMAVKITEYQQQVTKIKDESIGESHQPIGFTIIEEEEDEESND